MVYKPLWGQSFWNCSVFLDLNLATHSIVRPVEDPEALDGE